ncbi:MAG: hypothetical protein ACKO7N_10345, partial [Candidatus Nitrosotenuis sp.]
MRISERQRIKLKIQSVNPKRWWGDDFDVRFYLIAKLKKIKNRSILDIGGGIGIIGSELDSSNFRVNLDLNREELVECHEKVDSKIENVCASMNLLPFSSDIFDIVIL